MIREGHALVDFEAERKRLDGSRWWVLMNSQPLLFEGGPADIFWHADITERKLAEEALRRSEERFASVSENLPGAVYRRVLHTDGSISVPFMSSRSSEIFERESERITQDSDHLLNTMLPEDLPLYIEAVKRSAENLTPLDVEIRFPQEDGKIRWSHSISHPRKLESEARYRQLVQLSPDAVVVHRSRKFLMVNPAALEIFRVREERDLIGKPLADYMRAKETQLGLEVDVQVELAGIRLRADQRMVRQMLLNLLSNAVKFTPLGGSVTVSGRRNEDGGLALCVADTGIGMTPEDIPLALSDFGQVGRTLDQSFEGTGLGLPLVRSLAELHGGGLEIESAVGVGTRATIWFPKERVVGGR